MDTHSEYILKLLHKKTFINQWIQGKYKEKPLIIYGNPGIGKTSLAEYIIRSFIKLEVNIDFSKNCRSLDNYLDLSLYKKSITMMFEKEKKKAIIFDDLTHIQGNDKSLFKQIIHFSKKPLTNPVIYIFNHVSHKLIQTIYKKAFPIQLSFTKNQMISIVNQFYEDDKNINYSELIDKSNYNFHNIRINLKFYQEKTTQIQTFQKNENELFTFIKEMYSKNISDIYRYVISDYNIISLNVLENFIYWVFSSKLPYQKKVKLLYQVYNSYSIGDNFQIYLQKLNDWDLIDHTITNTVVCPLRYLLSSKIKLTTMEYNKYLSRSIIYTYNTKLLYLNEINLDILSVFYSLILDNNFENAYKLSSHYNIQLKISEKFSKYFSDKIKKKTLQKLFKQL